MNRILKYVGSKNRISKYIAPILQKCINENNIKTYYEPFVGGANMIDKIKCKNRIGNDINKELIAMWKELQNGWIPCDEHLPEENEAYLCTIQRLEDSNIWTDKLMYYPKRGWIEESKDSKVDEEKFKILAWRPLPEPYSENKGQMVVERI